MDDENAGEGREVHKGTLVVMWNGAWLEMGEAEFLAERGRVIKVLSYTPKEFSKLDAADMPQPISANDVRRKLGLETL